MGQMNPGLEPRKLEGEVEIHVESDRLLDASTDIEKPSVETPVETPQVEENTPTVQEETKTDEVPEQPLTNRASERIQTLDARALAAEARAQQAEQMLQRLVNVQTQQPVQSESETLAKQYRTYNSTLGYPEDPKEFASFTANGARLAAQQESMKIANQQNEQRETAEFLRAYPDAQNDPILIGAIAAHRSQAQQRGSYLSWKDAADIASKDLDSRVSKRAVAAVAHNDADKAEAYVETTRGASSSRATPATPDIDKMSLKEKEAFLKQTGNW
jgi:hypothetical protein